MRMLKNWNIYFIPYLRLILHSIDLNLSFMNFTIYIFDQLFSAIFRKSFTIIIYYYYYFFIIISSRNKHCKFTKGSISILHICVRFSPVEMRCMNFCQQLSSQFPRKK